MGRLKVGVVVDCFRLGIKAGIKKTAEIGADGFQMWATAHETAPWNFSQTARREFRRFVASFGLEVSALCGDFGFGFTDPRKVDELASKTKQIIDLAADLGVYPVTTHVGVVPEDEKAPAWGLLAEVLGDIGRYAESRSCCLAIETGPEDPAVLRKFLDHMNNPGLRVNYDPANLVMRGFDHVSGVVALAPYIVHTHAKDGSRKADGTRGEAPLGQGQVQWPEYLGALEQVGYHGYLTVERETGSNPVEDVTQAVRFLRQLQG